MKKTFLAFAALSQFSTATLAQSTLTLYGIVDLGLVSVTNATASTNNPTPTLPVYSSGNEFKLRDGVHSGSRLGLRGSEDLGGGLSALFVLEAGILTDTGASDQGGILFGRQAYVGLRNPAGTLSFGRQYVPHYLAMKAIDALDDAFGGGAGVLIPTNGKRVNNAIRYATPSMGGYSGELFYSLGEVTGNIAASSNLGATATYAAGPLMLKVAYHEAKNATASDKSKNTLIGGTYQFSIVKAHAAYGTNKGVGSVDNADLLLGLSLPFGQHTVLTSVVHKHDKAVARRDATLRAMAYTYALSKRTNLYASYMTLQNENGATYRSVSATAPLAGQTGAVGGTRELNAGLRHQF